MLSFKKCLTIIAALSLAACAADRQAELSYKKNEAEVNRLIHHVKTNRPYQTSSDTYVFGEDSHTNTATHISGNKRVVNAQINNQKLSQIYRQWAGTRYRLGGTSHRGIDCSAFMQETFAQAFGVSLPRSTSEQRYVGKQIAKNELKQGDLVFFRGNHHVGVYIGNNQFMHSSSSSGVTISSLNEHYWAKNYTQSRRVL